MTTDAAKSRYVVDTSGVLKWFVQSDEKDWQPARELREAYVQKRCSVSCPQFLARELANALKTGRKFTAAEIKIISESFRALDIVLESLQRAIDLAAAYGTAVYNSHFLASAIDSNSVLVTADELFIRKVGNHRHLLNPRQFGLTR